MKKYNGVLDQRSTLIEDTNRLRSQNDELKMLLYVDIYNIYFICKWIYIYDIYYNIYYRIEDTKRLRSQNDELKMLLQVS